MAKLVHFRKELVSNPVMIGGNRVAFEVLSGNRGVIVLDEEKPEDVEVIKGLKEFAEKHKFGVVAVSAEEYENVKKNNPPATLSPRRKEQKLRVMQRSLPKKSNPTKAVPAAKPATTAPVAPGAAAPLTRAEAGKVEFDAGMKLARAGEPLPDNASDDAKRGYNVIDQKTKLRLDGPTLAEWKNAGWKEEEYPPQGFAARTDRSPLPPFVPRTAAVDDSTPPAPPADSGDSEAPKVEENAEAETKL